MRVWVSVEFGKLKVKKLKGLRNGLATTETPTLGLRQSAALTQESVSYEKQFWVLEYHT